jgi:hypothetical protein
MVLADAEWIQRNCDTRDPSPLADEARMTAETVYPERNNSL